MNRRLAERNIVVLLFVFVIVLFSFAQKDTQKIKQLYTETEKKAQKLAEFKSTMQENK